MTWGKLTTSKDVNRTEAVSKSKVVLLDIAVDSLRAYKRFMNQTSLKKLPQYHKETDINNSQDVFHMTVQIGTKTPNLKVSEWVQGLPTNIDKEKDNVVLIEVFQVNCPGCFLYGIPQAIEIYQKYRKDGVTVLGVATAFEDFDKNTVENLRLLLTEGKVIGETLKALGQYGQLVDGSKLPYKIPFPVAMDFLKKEDGQISQARIDEIIQANVPGYESYSENQKLEIIERVKQYLKSKEYSAQTFDEFALRGTPSTILIDKKGVLRDVAFGTNDFLEENIKKLLSE